MNASTNAKTTAQELGKGMVGAVYKVDSLAQWVQSLRQTAQVIKQEGRFMFDAPAAVKVMDASQRAVAEQEVAMHKQVCEQEEKHMFHIVPNLYGYLVVVKDGVEQHLICMEYVPGKSLSDRARTGVFTKDVYERLAQLYYKLWRCGFVHGDPHKGNVMESDKGELLLIDMAQAKPIEQADVDTLDLLCRNKVDCCSDKEFAELIKKFTPAGKRSDCELISQVRARVDRPVQVRTAPSFLRKA